MTFNKDLGGVCCEKNEKGIGLMKCEGPLSTSLAKNVFLLLFYMYSQ